MLDNRSRLILEANFIFSLWKNPKYYHMFLKKMVTDPSVFFKNKSSLFYFSIGEQMATKGYQVFDVATVVAYVSGYPELQEEFETYGGYATVAKIMEKVSEENRETYFIEIMKANCIDSLNAQGLINSEEEKAIAEMTIEEMRLFYTNKVNKIFYKQGATVKVQDTFIDDEDIDKLDSGAEMGLNIGNTSPLLNYEILGLNTGLTFVGGTVNTGKAQKLSAKVMTPNGYTTIGQIKIGDKICGEDGKVYSVTGVFDRGIKKNYRVKFNDGSYTECCDEHLWNVNKTTFKDKNKFVTVMLKDILNDSVGLKSKSDNAYRYSIPEYQPVYMNEKEHIIPSYLLGVLLGDGYLCGQTLSISSIETDVIDKCKLLLDNDYTIKKSGSKNYSWNLINTKEKYNKYKREIKRLDLEKTSKEKFIPDEYKYDSVENRLELLRGLFDTDGCVATKSNNYSICTKSNRLKDDILFIARSLGMLSSAKWANRKDNKNKECWCISIRFNEDMKPFSSKKHTEKYKPNKRNKSLRRKIASIEYIGEEQMRCIMVDNPSHLYLTDDFIVTHNTSFIMGIMVRSFLKSKLKCCVISNEQGLLEFKRIMLAMAIWELYGDQTDLTRRRIKIGNYNTMEKGVMMEAKDYCNEHYAKYMKFVEMPDYCIEEVRMIIDYLTPMGFGGFIYDVFKAETNQMQVVNEMKTMSNNLFLTSKSNNVSTVATIQLGLSYNHVRHLTMETISTSKHITEPATEVLLMRPMWSDEVTGGAYDINIYNYLYDKHGQVMKDGSGKPLKKPIHIEGDDYKDVILLFLAKTRNTRKGTCIAYRFNGDYNIWEELGYCTPSMEDKTK